MSIAILCPTRGRPQKFKRMVESAHATAKHITIHAGFCGNDKEVYDSIPGVSEVIYPEYLPTVHKWNDLASKAPAKTKLFMLAADDIIFETPGWDNALLEHYEKLANKVHVYAMQDSRKVDGTPHPIVTREYIDAMGYFLPPFFLHWYIDSWTVAIAKHNGCFSHLTDMKLTHDKPSDKGWDHADDTHLSIRKNGWWQRDEYVAKTCAHFLEAEKIRLSKHMSTTHHISFMKGLA